jgi:hypothetical protein
MREIQRVGAPKPAERRKARRSAGLSKATSSIRRVVNSSPRDFAQSQRLIFFVMPLRLIMVVRQRARA